MTVPSALPRPAVLLLAALAAAACGGGEEAPEPSGPDFSGLEADQVMVGVEHYLTRDGVRRAHLTADTVFMLDEGSTARLRRFTVDFFDEQGRRTSVLRAVDGLYDIQAGDMRASENVRVVDDAESQRLRTAELTYEAATGKLRSEADFVLLRGRDTIRGTGFVTDPGLDSLRTRRPSVVSPPESARAAGRASDRDSLAPDTASEATEVDGDPGEPAPADTAPADTATPDTADGTSAADTGRVESGRDARR